MKMSFGDVTISVIMSVSKCLQTGSLSVIIRRRRNTRIFLFSKLILVKLVSQTIGPLQQ